MLTHDGVYLRSGNDDASDTSRLLHTDGFVVLRRAFDTAELATLRTEVDAVFDAPPADKRRANDADEYRYEMFNHSAAVQALVGDRRILDVVEPLLGANCHVIANTAWRNPPGRDITHGGGGWHIDSGPHVPRPPGVEWDTRIPYPVFAVAVHVLFEDMPMISGPTGVIPGSHTSGQAPPGARRFDDTLTWNGVEVVPLVAAAGDVALFVSDIWHRRLPNQAGDPGRYFVQIHYGRRDIAQRLHTTARTNQVSAEAAARAGADGRARSVIGLHDPLFYDG